MLDAYRDLIDELLETPRAIRDAIAENRSQAAAERAVAEIARIRDHDLLVLERARAMMQRADAYFDETTPLSDAVSPILKEVLCEMEAARGDLVSLLINLSLKDWERTAILKSRGEITLSELVEDHVDFDEVARARVQEILENS